MLADPNYESPANVDAAVTYNLFIIRIYSINKLSSNIFIERMA